MSTVRPKVLIVDDIEANLVALEALLGSLNCELVRAGSGNEALLLLLKNDFAVMLLDVHMPDMDGFEVARYARENPNTRRVPIVFVTAMHETKENVFRGYEAGAFDVLFKPIDPYVLRSKVQLFLSLYEGRWRLEQEMKAHRETLAELEAFNYSVSHDLRAPLRPLDGFSKALLEDYGDRLDDTAKNYLERIQAAARRMGHLIDDLLQLSRMSRAEVTRQPVDLAALCEVIVADVRANAPADGRRVEFTAPPGLTVQADPRLLRIAMENLLRNAWKFTKNRPEAHIELGVREGVTNGRLKETAYFVRDDGVGFDPAHASKLFRPFQRLHAVSAFEGTGIGLAIVDRIIRRHGGRIWAESAPDHGATFLFTLTPPALPSARQEPTDSSSAAAVPVPSVSSVSSG